MTLQLTPRRVAALTAMALLCALYLANLTGMGMVSADEPRYADIGRAMATSGDWITPRLQGTPWFEKPALLYWMIAASFHATADPDLAPRLPVVLLSVGFLAFFWLRVRTLWDVRVASFATAILATSAGWMAFSRIAVTDLPLAVFFSTAVLLTLGESTPAQMMAAGISLGFAVLAKSLVPLVLFIPVVALNFRRLVNRRILPAYLAFTLVALPWYVLCYARNGFEFVRVLFLQQQFGRFFSPERQHEQHWWFYFPALLLLLFPWFPALAWTTRDFRDRRVRTLAAVFVFGFVFFSASLNKLNGYLLPLIPAVSILIGIGLARSPRPERAIVIPIALLGALPVAAGILPAALATGFGSTTIPWVSLAAWIAGAALVGLLLARLRGERAVAASAALAAGAFLWFQYATFPAIDASASARPLWRTGHPACAPERERWILYGLNYYARRKLPPCAAVDQPATTVVR